MVQHQAAALDTGTRLAFAVYCGEVNSCRVSNVVDGYTGLIFYTFYRIVDPPCRKKKNSSSCAVASASGTTTIPAKTAKASSAKSSCRSSANGTERRSSTSKREYSDNFNPVLCLGGPSVNWQTTGLQNPDCRFEPCWTRRAKGWVLCWLTLHKTEPILQVAKFTLPV